MTLLQVRDLRVAYRVDGADLVAVDGVSFDLDPGARLGLVGESGSGKTSIARALLRLIPEAQVTGSVRIGDVEVLSLGPDALRRMRGARIALAAQGSGSAFSPVHKMRAQMADPLVAHGVQEAEAASRIEVAARLMRLRPELLDRYPHQLSGGEKQRAMLAMAIAGRPEVLVADEPTSGLDPVTAAAVLDDLVRVQAALGFALLISSHNLAAVARVTERTAVLYAGQIVESVTSSELLEDPLHPYTWGLAASHPALHSARDLRGIRGLPPDPVQPPPGCRFHPRCTQAEERCRLEEPQLVPLEGRRLRCHLGGLQVVLRASDLTYSYADSNGRLAVDGVGFQLRHGEVVAVVGETGSGKTTLARLLIGLLSPARGGVCFEGKPLQRLAGDEAKHARRRLQMVFQDPYEAISARLTVLDAVREPLDVQRIGPKADRDHAAHAALEAVRLPTSPAFLGARSHQLSGGQLQRVAVARALILEPRVLIADEPVSMLDGSEQANLLNLLKELQVRRGLALVFISHDIAAACRLADRVLVLREGRVVEQGSPEQVTLRPGHEYTRLLIESSRGGGNGTHGGDA